MDKVIESPEAFARDMATGAQLFATNAVEAQDMQVLRAAEAWIVAGYRVWLATVVETYGSAPRPIGSMAALNSLRQVVGSISGGCVEDDLMDLLMRDATSSSAPLSLVYGRDTEERARLRLPCNGHLRIWLEPAPPALIRALRQGVNQGLIMNRELDMRSGRSSVGVAAEGAISATAGDHFSQIVGPTDRLILIGASEVSRSLAPIAMGLGFRVSVIDPRREYLDTWPHLGCELLDSMPDDAIAANPPDARTAVVALSHDPKLDDLALMEALKSPAYYVGAMGSKRTTEARKCRLELFDLRFEEIARLRGPVGLEIGARTPPEIAVSVAADLVRERRLARGRAGLVKREPSGGG